jgi:hypothetical protein
MNQKRCRVHTYAAQQRALQVAFWILLGCNERLGVSKEDGLGHDVRSDTDPVSDGEQSDAGSPSPPRPDAAVSPGPHCQSGIEDGDESDIDCGGLDCDACVAGAGCARHTDCQSGLCRAGLCVAAACDDGVQNGNETGVDCGGSQCQNCRSKTCNCASSDGFQPLGCDETEGFLAQCGWPLATTPDGSVATFTVCYLDPGSSSTSHARAFRWTRAGGSEVLTDYGTALALSSDGTNALVRGDLEDSLRLVATGQETAVSLPLDSLLSADGSSVTGVTRDQSGNFHLARWTRAGGLATLADLPSGADGWTVRALTPNGSTVVGEGRRSAGNLPFRWSASSGLQDFGTLPSSATGAIPLQVSNDGAVIAGYTTELAGDLEVFRWTQADALQIITTATDAFALGSYPLSLSADGSVLAGTGTLGEHSISAFRWSSADGARLLGSSASYLVDMSSDGSLGLGDAVGSGGDFLWRGDTTSSIPALLETSGVDLTGWDQLTPIRMSADGSVVYGTGSCGGTQTYFRWVLEH